MSRPSACAAELAMTECRLSDEPKDDTDLELGVCTDEQEAPRTMDHSVSMGMGRPLPPLPGNPEDYTVEFNGPDDPEHPYNWNRSNKLLTSILACSATYIAALASAIFAPAAPAASAELDVSAEVGALGTALYVLGFAAGPVLWAPASELRGRRLPLAASTLLGGAFGLGAAAAKDAPALAVCRFFAGACGAGPLAVVPGVLADLYDDASRGAAVSLYALCVFGGPSTAPLVGGFVTVASGGGGWRWALYVPAILSLACGAACLAFLRETYAPRLLVARAAALRGRTGNWAVHARHERAEVEPWVLVEKYFSRPVRMLVTEPTILLVSLYMSFIYGLVYCLLGAYPLVFEGIYGMKPGVGGLPFLGLLVGQAAAVGVIVSRQKGYVSKLRANNNVPVPEWRLGPPLVGAPIFALGIFWFGWTAYTGKVHWAVPTVAGVFIGFGNVSVFLPCFNYIVDAYLPFAASAVAANIILRSAVAAGFPLFSKQMFQNLGIQWAATLLGCLAAVMIPIPYAFRVYGPRLRKKSRLLRE